MGHTIGRETHGRSKQDRGGKQNTMIADADQIARDVGCDQDGEPDGPTGTPRTPERSPSSMALRGFARNTSRKPGKERGTRTRSCCQVVPAIQCWLLRCDRDGLVRRAVIDLADRPNAIDGPFPNPMPGDQCHPREEVGYNVGPGRVKEWIARYGDPRDPSVDAVDWVERIPFKENRIYVQRVMENLQIYRSQFRTTPHHTIEADMRGG